MYYGQNGRYQKIVNFHGCRWVISLNFYAAPFTFCHTFRVWRLLSFIFLHTVLVIVLPHFCGLTCIAQRPQPESATIRPQRHANCGKCCGFLQLRWSRGNTLANMSESTAQIAIHKTYQQLRWTGKCCT